MSNSKPLISILINNHNYGRFLRDAIGSALNQTYRYVEVIVVDDGSTDDSREIIASYGNQIVPIVKENGGQASALNAGFVATRGEWICLLDSDDTWSPEKVERIVEEASAFPEAVLIYHRVRFVLEDLRPTERLYPAGVFKGDISERVASGGGWWAAAPTSGLCFRSDALRRIGCVPEEDFRICADAYLYSLVPFLGPVCGMMDCLGQYRQHDSNNFHSAQSATNGSVVKELRSREQFIRVVTARVNSRLERMKLGIVLDLRRHWGYQVQRYYLGMAGHSSAPRLCWEALRLPGEPSVIARLRTAGGLLLHGWRLR